MDKKEYLKEYRKGYTKKRVCITVSESEYKTLEAKAKLEGVKVNTLVKNMAFYYMLNKTYVPNSVISELRELSFLIRNIANNVNQSAHYSHIIRGLVNENGLLEELKKLEDLVKSYTVEKIKKTQ